MEYSIPSPSPTPSPFPQQGNTRKNVNNFFLFGSMVMFQFFWPLFHSYYQFCWSLWPFPFASKRPPLNSFTFGVIPDEEKKILRFNKKNERNEWNEAFCAVGRASSWHEFEADFKWAISYFYAYVQHKTGVLFGQSKSFVSSCYWECERIYPKTLKMNVSVIVIVFVWVWVIASINRLLHSISISEEKWKKKYNKYR